MNTVAAQLGPPVESDWDATVAEWLAGLFRAPLSLADVISYRNGLGASLLEELELQPGCIEGVRAMQDALADGGPAAALTRRLGMAFMQLFEGVGGSRTVSPFESAHRSQSGPLFQAPAQDMTRRLSSAGLILAGGEREPADHLSIELALLAHDVRSPDGRQETASLLEDRLLNWLSGFANAVGGADPTGFYAGAASVLVGFLQAQHQAIELDGEGQRRKGTV